MGTKHKEKKASKVRAAKIIKQKHDLQIIYKLNDFVANPLIGGGEGEEEQSSSSRWQLEEER